MAYSIRMHIASNGIATKKATSWDMARSTSVSTAIETVRGIMLNINSCTVSWNWLTFILSANLA